MVKSPNANAPHHVYLTKQALSDTERCPIPGSGAGTRHDLNSKRSVGALPVSEHAINLLPHARASHRYVVCVRGTRVPCGRAFSGLAAGSSRIKHLRSSVKLGYLELIQCQHGSGQAGNGTRERPRLAAGARAVGAGGEHGRVVGVAAGVICVVRAPGAGAPAEVCTARGRNNFMAYSATKGNWSCSAPHSQHEHGQSW